MRHINIPIFIPHMGCPHDCVFCSQKQISGKLKFDISAVDREISSYLDNIHGEAEAEIAFFGGSFTGIEKNDMIYLLKCAEKYYMENKVKSIRISTRPDYINTEILALLKEYHVKTIELGIQSLKDRVLRKSERGHTSRQSEYACNIILESGFTLIGQMMAGLPDSNLEDELYTASRLCEIGIHGARIYPVVVIENTKLHSMTRDGEYIPLTTDETVLRSAEILSVFIKNSVPVIRIGLCSSDIISNDSAAVIAGGYHPAIGEMVESLLFYRIIKTELEKYHRDYYNEKNIIVLCPKGCVSKISGQKKHNKIKIMREFNIKNISIIESDTISGYNVEIYIKEGDGY